MRKQLSLEELKVISGGFKSIHMVHQSNHSSFVSRFLGIFGIGSESAHSHPGPVPGGRHPQTL